MTEYPAASHAFDNPLGAEPAAVSPKFESVIRDDTDGRLINTETKEPFTYKDACVVHGPHLGYDPGAAQAATAAVAAILKTVFNLSDQPD